MSDLKHTQTKQMKFDFALTWLPKRRIKGWGGKCRETFSRHFCPDCKSATPSQAGVRVGRLCGRACTWRLSSVSVAGAGVSVPRVRAEGTQTRHRGCRTGGGGLLTAFLEKTTLHFGRVQANGKQRSVRCGLLRGRQPSLSIPTQLSTKVQVVSTTNAQPGQSLILMSSTGTKIPRIPKNIFQ